MRTLRRLIFIFLLFSMTLGLTAFIYQNQQSVTLKFANWSAPQYPLFLAIILAFAAGALATGALTLVEIFRIETRLRRSKRMVEMLEREVDALRNQPLYEEPPRTEASAPSPVERKFMHEGLPEDSLEISERKKMR